jgi:SAM-dependent methyltransferase
MRRRRLTRDHGRPAPDAGAVSYDEVPYPGAAFQQTHPDRLATLTRLYGGRPRAVETCRVLELGCGDGGNLIPMAYAMPEATLVGVDLNAAAVGRGRATVEALGLQNVRLDAGDIAGLDARALGRFDHVIAHGVYSWVPEHVRAALLALCRECLDREGVAFVSFNALPGGHVRRALRDALRWEVDTVADPAERIAAGRALLRRLKAREPYDGALGRELQRMLDAPDALVYHDALASTNADQSISRFAGDAAAAGLRYLCEAELHEGADGVADGLAAELGDGDRIAREQRLDVLTLRMFRQALLVRADGHATERLDPRALHGLRVASELRPAKAVRLQVRAVDEFRAPKRARLRVDHPVVKAALLVLGEAWPHSLPFGALAGAAVGRLQRSPGAQDEPTLAAALLEAYRQRAIELHAWAPPVAERLDERPVASALARRQAEAGEPMATLRHTTVSSDDERVRRLVTLLDGTRDRRALAEAMGLGQRAGKELASRLERLRAAGLLEAPELSSSRRTAGS